MKVQNIVRKAVALGSGAALVGTTLMGAFAYDLSTYPAKFIVDGKFDGKIVVGEKAATPDVIGAIDIAASLQGASVSKVAIPGAAGKVSFEGDSFEVATSSDALELREPIGDVAETITSADLAGLKSGKLTTPEGSTNYQQYLRLQDDAAIQEIAVNYVTNSGEDNEKMSDYMVVENVADAPFIRWEVQFDEGFEAELEDTTADALNSLEDFEDRTLNIMGTDYTIVSAEVQTEGDLFEMQLMGGSVPDTLREGETKTYTINGVDYEVTLVFVSDPASAGRPEVKFSVNGELTQAMAEADTDVLSGGMQIGVRDILVNAREGVASFYLGAHKLVISDPDVTTGAFDGDIEVNDEVDESDVITVEGSISGTTFEITSIEYQITMDSAEGSGGVAYVPKGHGVRELMDEPELMISDALDIKYGGLTSPKTAQVVFDPNGDDEYTLTFTNIEGDEYKNVPFLSTDSVLKFGDQDDDLVLAESEAGTGYNIGVDDYFIVSSKLIAEADRAVTNVLRYDGYDGETRQIEFENLAGGTVSATLNTTGSGTFNVGGHTYDVDVNVGAASTSADDDAAITVDLDGSGTITDGEMPIITSWGGLAFSFLNATNATGTLAVLGTGDVADVLNTIGDGNDFEDVLTSPITVRFTGTVVERRFDTGGSNETFTVSFTENAGATELDVDFVDASYDGPSFDNADEWTKFEFGDSEDNSDIQTGMTDYGVLVRLDEPDDSSDPNTLTFTVPEEQILAQVFVTMGDVSASEGGAGVADKVNPIAVGLAVLDKDAPAIGSDNLIVVGGPCANTVAAELMGNPESCVEGFTEGKAMIKAFGTDKVSILVAGYSAQDTLGASRVLADYKAYSLKGEAVEVVVADLKNIKVNAME